MNSINKRYLSVHEGCYATNLFTVQWRGQ